MRSSKSQGSSSASSATERHVQMAHPAWEPFVLSERLISTTIELSVSWRRHPEVETVACVSENRLHAMTLDGSGAGLRAAGKESAMTGVAQAAIGVPVASAPQSATTGKRFFDAMGSPCFILCELVVSYCWLRLMHSPRPVAPAPAAATLAAKSCFSSPGFAPTVPGGRRDRAPRGRPSLAWRPAPALVGQKPLLARAPGCRRWWPMRSPYAVACAPGSTVQVIVAT